LLVNTGFVVLGDNTYSPGIVTISLPDYLSSKNLGDELKENGMIISYESDYLVNRNWVQFALMGEHTLTEFEIAISKLEHIVKQVS